MSGVNKVILLGRLGNDPEVKTISNGNTVARLSLATSETWVDKNGQRQERTEWHKVVVWGKVAELVGRRLSKGKQLYVEGRLETRSWEDQQGQKRYTTEIVANNVQFVEKDTANEGRSDYGSRGSSSSSSSEPDFGPEPSFDSSEEIPF